MAFMYFEGTSDFLAATPAIIVTLRASGSINAGQALAWDVAGSSDVYVPWNVNTGSPIQCAGIALQTVSSGQPVPVCVMGIVKNMTPATNTYAYTAGMWLLLSGSGTLTASSLTHASTLVPYFEGEVISGSVAGSKYVAFISNLA